MTLDELQGIILSRKSDPVDGSYVASLIGAGKDRILKKIGEESAEVIIASKSGDRKQLLRELADLWFHSMVLMAEEKISAADILDELQRRHENTEEKRENV